MRIMLILSLLWLAGCATKYQDMGFSGGVASEQVTSDTFRIVTRGNGYTNATTIQDYTLLKAAETAKQNGGTHFLLISAADASSTGQYVMAGTSQTTFAGNTAFTTSTPGTVTTFVKPGQDAYIRIINVKPGQAPPAGAVSADEIIQYIGLRVKRG
jgi:hypothetical protein